MSADGAGSFSEAFLSFWFPFCWDCWRDFCCWVFFCSDGLMTIGLSSPRKTTTSSESSERDGPVFFFTPCVSLSKNGEVMYNGQGFYYKDWYDQFNWLDLFNWCNYIKRFKHFNGLIIRIGTIIYIGAIIWINSIIWTGSSTGIG